MVLADCEDPRYIFAALTEGAQGYFPTSLNLAVAIAALRLIHAGGLYVPKAAVAKSIGKKSPQPEFLRKPRNPGASGNLTARQHEVLNLLRQGRSNVKLR